MPFVVAPSQFEEPPTPNVAVALADLVVGLARSKAQEVAGRTEDGLVIGADTLVSLSLEACGVPLGKPRNAAEACQMLAALAGRPHSVFTGVAIVHVGPGARLLDIRTAAVRTVVRFRDLSPEMIADYVATGEPLDKAGAYGAQGYAAPFIESFDGDFFNVVGLPLCALGRLIEEMGFSWWRARSRMPPLIG